MATGRIFSSGRRHNSKSVATTTKERFFQTDVLEERLRRDTWIWQITS